MQGLPSTLQLTKLCNIDTMGIMFFTIFQTLFFPHFFLPCDWPLFHGINGIHGFRERGDTAYNKEAIPQLWVANSTCFFSTLGQQHFWKPRWVEGGKKQFLKSKAHCLCMKSRILPSYRQVRVCIGRSLWTVTEMQSGWKTFTGIQHLWEEREEVGFRGGRSRTSKQVNVATTKPVRSSEMSMKHPSCLRLAKMSELLHASLIWRWAVLGAVWSQMRWLFAAQTAPQGAERWRP